MDNASGLYPLQHCKIVHLVRHAQGIHNLVPEGTPKTSPELFDASLSTVGWEEVDNLREDVHATGLLKRIELVITSPLLRTLQTATGAFGGDKVKDGEDAAPLLMVADAKNNRDAVSSLECPPLIAVELCRERLGINTCDKRRNISEYKHLFPAIDFSLIETDDDTMWTPDVRENDEDLAARGIKFINWLCSRKEREIAVVTHSAFLSETLKKFGDDCKPEIKADIGKYFTNCELRSMVLVNKRV